MQAKLFVFEGMAKGFLGKVKIGVKTHQGEGFALDLAKRALIDGEGTIFTNVEKVSETPIDENSTEELGIAFINVKEI